MFKELLPQNEALGTMLDTLLISLGWLTSIAGGIAGLITFRWKTKYQAKIQAEMQAKADELSQTLSEKITRRSKAFDLRIQKQYEFYEKFGTMPQELTEKSMLVFVSVTFVNSGLPIEINNVAVEKGKNIELLKPDLFKNMEILGRLNALIMSYSVYLNKEIIEVCNDCLSKYREFFMDSFQCVKSLEKEENIDALIDKMQSSYDSASEKLKAAGEEISKRIDPDIK